MSRRTPLAGGARLVEAPIPEDVTEQADPEPTNPGGGGGFWGFLGWWARLWLGLAALLALVAAFYALWLAAVTVWDWMGL